MIWDKTYYAQLQSNDPQFIRKQFKKIWKDITELFHLFYCAFGWIKQWYHSKMAIKYEIKHNSDYDYEYVKIYQKLHKHNHSIHSVEGLLPFWGLICDSIKSDKHFYFDKICKLHYYLNLNDSLWFALTFLDGDHIDLMHP